jgi:hypothetical protein
MPTIVDWVSRRNQTARICKRPASTEKEIKNSSMAKIKLLERKNISP